MPSEGEKHTQELEKKAIKELAPYALKSKLRQDQLGDKFRKGKTQKLEFRTEYHRDRDRIVWSKSFKRLQHKTQIFPHYSEDHYRRRLTHSLEVAQIATTIARALHLNEIATEAIALGHDLGHPPFGHAGEVALSIFMKSKIRAMKSQKKFRKHKYHDIPLPLFGFDHCVHAIEVVSFIEREYDSETGSGGLNLTFDVRDGILKHMYDYGEVPKDRPLSKMSRVTKFKEFVNYKNNKGSLEAQCVYFADKVAYLLGDVEDGLRSHILVSKSLDDHEFMKCLNEKHTKYGSSGTLRLADNHDFTLFRSGALSVLILDCIYASLEKIKSKELSNPEEVLGNNERMVYVSEKLSDTWNKFYDDFLRNYMFKHEDVTACTFKAKNIVSGLFEAYFSNEDLIPKEYRDHSQKVYSTIGIVDPELLKLITVRNYIAGMTDAYATTQHVRLFMSSEHAL